jgi:hypothetical protein
MVWRRLILTGRGVFVVFLFSILGHWSRKVPRTGPHLFIFAVRWTTRRPKPWADLSVSDDKAQCLWSGSIVTCHILVKCHIVVGAWWSITFVRDILLLQILLLIVCILCWRVWVTTSFRLTPYSPAVTYVPPGLLRNSVFCPHSLLMCVVPRLRMSGAVPPVFLCAFIAYTKTTSNLFQFWLRSVSISGHLSCKPPVLLRAFWAPFFRRLLAKNVWKTTSAREWRAAHMLTPNTVLSLSLPVF